MKRHTKKDIENAQKRLNEARYTEQNIVDKYSTNFKEWSKACDNVNKLKNKYNKMVREFNYDNGFNTSGLVV